MDSNGSLTIAGGSICISGPEDGGNSPLDYAGEGTITGGTLMAAGAGGMTETLEAGGAQGIMMVSLSGSAGDTIEVSDSTGTVPCSMTAESSYSCVIVSTESMVSGGTYSVSNGSATVEATLDGLSYSEGAGGTGGMAGSPDRQGQNGSAVMPGQNAGGGTSSSAQGMTGSGGTESAEGSSSSLKA